MIQVNQFLLNGQRYYTNQPINLLNLVNYFNYNNSLLVVEYNNLICNKKNLRKIYINDKDKIEIVIVRRKALIDRIGITKKTIGEINTHEIGRAHV